MGGGEHEFCDIQSKETLQLLPDYLWIYHRSLLVSINITLATLVTIKFLLLCVVTPRLADIRFLNVIKALCFFYYLLILPCIWLGKKIWWGMFADTVGKKKSAEAAVLKAAKKKGTPEYLEKLGAVSLRKEMEKYMREEEQAEMDRNRAEERERAERAKEIAEREERLGMARNRQVSQGLSLREEVENYHQIPRSWQGWQSPAQEVAVDLEFYNDTLWEDLEEMPDLLDAGITTVASSGELEGQAQTQMTSEDGQAQTSTTPDGQAQTSGELGEDQVQKTPTTPEDGQAQTPTTPEDGQAQTPTTPEDGQVQTPTTPEDGQAQTPTTPEDGQAQTPTTPEDGQAQTPTTPTRRKPRKQKASDNREKKTTRVKRVDG